MPLVLFPQLGLYRDEVCQTLDALGRSWRISYSSASLVALAAASAEGLGLTLLPASCRLPQHRVLGSEQGLPVIDSFELALFCRQPHEPLQRELAEALVAFGQLRWQ